MAYLSELSVNEFKAHVSQDSEFGLKIAKACGIIDPDTAATLEDSQKQRFNNYGLLRLLGCRVGFINQSDAERYRQEYPYTTRGFSTRHDLGLRVSVRPRKHERGEPEPPPHLSVESMLALTEEQADIFTNERIYKLVVKDYLPFDRAVTLSPEELRRLEDKSAKDYSALFSERKNFEEILRFLTTIPKDHWPDSHFVEAVFKSCDDARNAKEITPLTFAQLPVEYLEAFEAVRDENGNGGYDALDRILAMASPVKGFSYDSESGEIDHPVIHPAVLQPTQYTQWESGELMRIALAGNAVRCGLISFEEAAALNEEQARVAHELGSFVLYKENPDLNVIGLSNDEIHNLDLKQAKAIKKLGFLIEKDLADAEELMNFAGNYRMQNILRDNRILVEALIAAYGEEDILSVLSGITYADIHDKGFVAVRAELERISQETPLAVAGKEEFKPEELQILYRVIQAAPNMIVAQSEDCNPQVN